MIFQGAQSWDKPGHAEKQEPGQGAVTSQKISRRAQIGGPCGIQPPFSPLSIGHRWSTSCPAWLLTCTRALDTPFLALEGTEIQDLATEHFTQGGSRVRGPGHSLEPTTAHFPIFSSPGPEPSSRPLEHSHCSPQEPCPAGRGELVPHSRPT